MPRTLDEIPHGREPNAVVHFYCLYLGESSVDAGIDSTDGCQHMLVIVEDVSRYTWLCRSRACMVNDIVEDRVRWCATFGPPTTW